ncbi:MAG: hypothetical protein CYG60_06735 [Actinobacteria bacterium]|nr:MAG: hypothetical protein CYG60_06735 [Actinomycetota bacterium]
MQMKNGWTLLREKGLGGEALYEDGQGFVRMELLPEELRTQLPALGSTDGQGEDATVYAKLFSPSGPFTWYVTEFDGEDTCFGYILNAATPRFSELGYFSLSELEGIGDARRLVLPIERDVTFSPQPLSEAKKAQ